jgi:hypothetical protein
MAEDAHVCIATFEGAHAMGFLDKFRSRATEAVDKHGDKIASGMDKAGQFVDKKTGGKHHDKIEKAKSRAGEALDRLDGKNDDIADERPGTQSTPPTSPPSPPSSTPPSGSTPPNPPSSTPPSSPPPSS